MKKAVVVLLLASPLFAATHVVDQKTFEAIAVEFSGERAQELDRRIVEYHRIQGSPMMESVAKEVILPALKAANVEPSIEQFKSDGATTYDTYVSPIGWTMRGGELWIEGATPIRVHGNIDAYLGTYQITRVNAYIRGTESPNDEVIVSAHLDHPKWSANDNASGSATLVESARTLRTLIDTKKLAPPRRTIHFIWVPEYFGTIAYLTQHPEKRSCTTSTGGCVVADINMDMVGEDTVKTNGRFYMTRAPMSVTSFLDALLPDILEQTRDANL